MFTLWLYNKYKLPLLYRELQRISWFSLSHWQIWSNWCLKLKKKWPVFDRISILKNLSPIYSLPKKSLKSYSHTVTQLHSLTVISMTALQFNSYTYIWDKFFKIDIVSKTGHFFFNFKHQLLQICQLDGQNQDILWDQLEEESNDIWFNLSWFSYMSVNLSVYFL